MLLVGTALLGALTRVVSGSLKPEVAPGIQTPITAMASEVGDIGLTTKAKTALLAAANIKRFDIAVKT